MKQAQRIATALGLVLLLVGQGATAAEFWVGWDFPRDWTPVPTAFVITYAADATQDLGQMQTQPSAPGACERFGTGPDVFCTIWPTCPSPGVLTFWVQALWGERDLSERSDPHMLCLFTAEKPCVCQDPATYTPPPQAPVVVPPLAATEIPPITTITIPAPPPFTPVFPPAPT
jgi:hypothetical protein